MDQMKTKLTVFGRDCLSGQYRCDNFQCIHSAHVCNGIVKRGLDCFDGSDEAYCEEWECLPEYWKCADNKQCIHAGNVCDGRIHCSDQSDENNKLCGCESNTWPCINGDGCISENTVCDAEVHCRDKSDKYRSVCFDWNCTEGKRKCHIS